MAELSTLARPYSEALFAVAKGGSGGLGHRCSRKQRRKLAGFQRRSRGAESSGH